MKWAVAGLIALAAGLPAGRSPAREARARRAAHRAHSARSDEREIRRLIDEINAAAVRRDVAFLNRVLSDDYVTTVPVRTRTHRYYSWRAPRNERSRWAAWPWCRTQRATRSARNRRRRPG